MSVSLSGRRSAPAWKIVGGMNMIVANVSVLEELRALKRELQDSL